MPITALCLLLLPLPAGAMPVARSAGALDPCAPSATWIQDEDDEAEVESIDLPDGGRIERTVVPSADGDPVVTGLWREWDAAQVLREEGSMVAGERNGDWKSFHETGKLAAHGGYVRGVRAGVWELFHADGSKAGNGNYKRGVRSGQWKCWDERGLSDRAESGWYRAVIEDYANGMPRVRGETRRDDRTKGGKQTWWRHGNWAWWSPAGQLLVTGKFRADRPHATWQSWWPGSDEIMLTGRYARFEREGDWLFRHIDGTVDPAMLSGRYKRGRRRGDLKEAGPSEDGGTLSPLSALAAPTNHPLADGELLRDIDELAALYLTGGNESAEASVALTEIGAYAIPRIIAILESLDLSSAADVAQGGEVADGMLKIIHQGHGFGWAAGTSVAEQAANRLSILRWHSLWELTRSTPNFIALLPTADDKGGVSPKLLDPGVDFESLIALSAGRLVASPGAGTVTAAAGIANAGPFALSFDPEAVTKSVRRNGTRDALDAALAWLISAQDGDGHWDCKAHEGETFDVGVSALAVLAIVGGGSTPEAGPHANSLAAALTWLRGKQGQDGRLGIMANHQFMYEHMIATRALAEAHLVGDPEQHKVLQLAVDFIVAAQAPDSGWRYNKPSHGDSDTSITVWAVEALVAAERAGIVIPSGVYQGALNWINEATQQESGRVGYTGATGGSARLPGVNEHIKADAVETLTAAAIRARMLLGQSTKRAPMIKQGADLVARRAPSEDQEFRDFYGWYHGTYALHALGGKRWDSWEKELKRVVLGLQIMDKGERHGTWDPNGAWGHSGGRVYSTALLALTLQVHHRGSHVD